MVCNYGSCVFRVTPTTSLVRTIQSKKLSPKFTRPYQILWRIGTLAYEIALRPWSAKLHIVFHISQLRMYVFDPTHVLELDDV